MKRIFLLAALCAQALVAGAQPARIIIFRHAEKIEEDKDAGLTARGLERAAALPVLLTQSPDLLGNAEAVLLCTRGSASRTNDHTHETLEPLAARLGLKINGSYKNSQVKAAAAFVLEDPSCRGKTVVICWTHTHIPDLIAALGVAPELPPWNKDVFDRILVISIQGGKSVLKNLPQRLLFGDNPK